MSAEASTAPAAEAAPAAAPAASAELLSKIRQQVEYYFSDANFRRDKFLRGKVAEDADGFVQLPVLLTFNRLRSLTESAEVIASALEDSSELELSGDRAAVRRVKPLASEDDSDKRTTYVKGRFHADATLDELIEFFNKHGKATRVQMRRFRATGRPADASNFKGSVFVEWASPEEAERFLAAVRRGEIVNTVRGGATGLPERKPAAAAEAGAAASSSASSAESATEAAAAPAAAPAGPSAAAIEAAAAAGGVPLAAAESRAEYWSRKKAEREEGKAAGKAGAAGGDRAQAKLDRIKESAATGASLLPLRAGWLAGWFGGRCCWEAASALCVVCGVPVLCGRGVRRSWVLLQGLGG
jgi:hypothetical protein